MNLSQENFGLDENVENKMTSGDSQWQLGSSSRESSHFSSDSNEYFQSSGGHELQILQKKETMLSRPVIPATKFEKLAFTRSYVASSCKTEFTFTQTVKFSVFLWNYIYNLFGKSLPSIYLYIFLGCYAPEHHLFLTKMVPVCHGLNFFWVLVGLLQLIMFSASNVTFLDYAVCGSLYNNPWNRCMEPFIYLPVENTNVSCYKLDDFIEHIKNKTVISGEWSHQDLINQNHFHLSQFNYYLERSRYLDEPRLLGISYTNLYIFFHFAFSSLLSNQIFKKSIWKAHALLHYTLTAVYAVALMHLYYSTYDEEITVTLPKTVESYMKADLDLLAESMTSPPVLHILTSRSKQEVKIGTETAIIVTSNALYYIFRGIVEYKLRKYCNHVTNATQHFTTGPALAFYWPLYLSNLYLGNLYSVFFFYLVFFVEFCSFTITHQLLIEVFVYQWQFLNRWTAALLILVMVTILESPLLGMEWVKMMPLVELCGTNIITLAEITIICLMYPLGRLIEDITFHYGMAPTLFTIFLLQIMFIHYLYKSTIMLKSLGLVVTNIALKEMGFMALILLFTLVIGLVLKLYKIVYKNQTEWTLIWLPDKYWGPSDLSSRLLRKKFKSEKYIASQAPRDLSRSLIKKAESKVYRLGLRYNYDGHRRSTQPNISYRIKNEVM